MHAYTAACVHVYASKCVIKFVVRRLAFSVKNFRYWRILAAYLWALLLLLLPPRAYAAVWLLDLAFTFTRACCCACVLCLCACRVPGFCSWAAVFLECGPVFGHVFHGFRVISGFASFPVNWFGHFETFRLCQLTGVPSGELGWYFKGVKRQYFLYLNVYIC